MISCTEFIPAYSEFFKFLEQNHGFEEVKAFWEKLFRPDGTGISLVNYVAKSGIRGCFDYWAHSLNEEAADFTMYLNEKRGFFRIVMHHCPSKGRLLEQKEKMGLEPYTHYCLHCDYYRGAVEKHGLRYLYDFTGVDRASCSILIYDPAVFDGRVIVDEDTEIMDRKASQNEYFHRDFHHSMNRCLHFVGEKFGEEELRALFMQYVQNALRPLLTRIRKEGLAPLKDYIITTYEKEKAPEAVSASLSDGTLQVEIAFCPAVRHLRGNGHEVSPWFSKSTEYTMASIAEACGLSFDMGEYDHKTGKTSYRFCLKEAAR